ncbi:sulfurtransferase TusA family protein [Albimonas pacifica]|uniref:tRNA 2-thiouridine synthesizing protein A n=1 Tax=Albimonas pacifica TaxID=1114924 RepID=A0A1I3GBA4_9RHOB|nr:sulfurtransferase TusA family protein [Albimonas pacifica]SFI20776.1 tRNA 2-thiouridine synthesizing protein A [Albimonas pacifica]
MSPDPLPVPDLEIDALGLICPLPVLRARKRLAGLPAGAVLAIVADDPMAAIDLPNFCAEEGHALLSDAPAPGGGRRFVIRKAG